MDEQPDGLPGIREETSLSPVDPSTVSELARLILTEMQHDIDTRIDWRLQQQGGRQKRLSEFDVGMSLGSLGIAIPLSGIAAATAGFAGLLLCWVGIVLVNVAWSQRR